MTDILIAPFGLFGPEIKAIYSHVKWVEKCPKEEQAKAFVKMWTEIIEVLRKSNLKFYLRRAPEYVLEKSFDDSESYWIASVRFSIGPSE